MSAPTGQVAPVPEDAWPNDTYSTPQKKLYFNGEPIQIMHQPANTDGNSIVLFRKSDVVSAGDLFDLSGYPFIDLKAGGSIQVDRRGSEPADRPDHRARPTRRVEPWSSRGTGGSAIRRTSSYTSKWSPSFATEFRT